MKLFWKRHGMCFSVGKIIIHDWHTWTFVKFTSWVIFQPNIIVYPSLEIVVICNIKFLIHVSRTAMIGWFNNLEIMEFVGQFLETIELLGTAEFGSSVTPQCFSCLLTASWLSFFFTQQARHDLVSSVSCIWRIINHDMQNNDALITHICYWRIML
jgi:hypothetical protein